MKELTNAEARVIAKRVETRIRKARTDAEE